MKRKSCVNSFTDHGYDNVWFHFYVDSKLLGYHGRPIWAHKEVGEVRKLYSCLSFFTWKTFSSFNQMKLSIGRKIETTAHSFERCLNLVII